MMSKTMKKNIFYIAALALIMGACSNEERLERENPAKTDTAATIPFRATIGDGATTRAFTEQNDSLKSLWEVGEKMAIIHGTTIDTVHVEEVSDKGAATIVGELSNAKDGEGLFVVYFGHDVAGITNFAERLKKHYDLVKLEPEADDEITFPDIIAVADSLVNALQDGTLATINAVLDFHYGEGTLSVSDDKATFEKSISLQPLYSVWKLALTTDGTTALKAKTFSLQVSTEIYTTNLKEPITELYLLFTPNGTSYNFFATDESGNYYAKLLTVKKELAGATYYQSKLTMPKLTDVAYVAYAADGTSTTKTVAPKDYTIISGSYDTERLTGGWYVVTGNTTLVNSWSPESDVNIILCDDATLNFDNMLGFQGRRLTIYGQSQGTGKFNISTDNNDYCLVAGALEIHGGNITIKGVNNTNGISISGSEKVAANFAMYHGELTVETQSRALTMSPIETELILGKGLELLEGDAIDKLEIADDQTRSTKKCIKISAPVYLSVD